MGEVLHENPLNELSEFWHIMAFIGLGALITFLFSVLNNSQEQAAKELAEKRAKATKKAD